jgi:hypothetical protein
MRTKGLNGPDGQPVKIDFFNYLQNTVGLTLSPYWLRYCAVERMTSIIVIVHGI